MNTPICVIVTVWNQLDKTLPCLDSILAQTYNPITILLVDNGSEDETIPTVSAQYPTVNILPQPTNLGPTGGYNQGFRWALEKQFPYIFLLNNDTILQPNCLTELMNATTTHPQVGLFMPKIYYAFDPQRIWSVGGIANNWTLGISRPGDNQLDIGQWSENKEIDEAPFCAVLLKATTLQTVGLPDESFFLYYEDLDFCLRMRQNDLQLRLVPSAQLYHVVSASSGGSDSVSERYWMARSSVIYFRKHTRSWRWALVFPIRFGSAIKTSIRLLTKGKKESFSAYWRGLRDGWQQELK